MKNTSWRACAAFLLCVTSAPVSQAQTLTSLASFNDADGALPLYGPLIQGKDGNLYGTTSMGGDAGEGTVFKVTPEGGLSTLHLFTPKDGVNPFGGLVQGTDGNFYGTTTGYGANGFGTVFKITPEGTLTVLHNFTSTEGRAPYDSLIQATDGDFYGTTYQGGASGYGTVFKITAGGTLTTLHSFARSATDGGFPMAGLVQATDGDFYGTTYQGGASGYGTVFKITPLGTPTTLHSFALTSTDGGFPTAGLVQAAAGDFYGTTRYGGSKGVGTVFKITSEGVLTKLYSFDSANHAGNQPWAGLLEASDGNFYGATLAGGGAGCNCGTLFKITPQGTPTTLHSFDGKDGTSPYASLVQATNGDLYGTTRNGGTVNAGTIFSLAVGLP